MPDYSISPTKITPNRVIINQDRLFELWQVERQYLYFLPFLMRISILAFSLFIPNSSLGPVLEDFLSKKWDSLRTTSSNPNIVSQCTCLNMNCYKYCLFIFVVTDRKSTRLNSSH